MKVLVLTLLLVASTLAIQSYPGTSSRPILSNDEVANYTKDTYLQGWAPESIVTTQADYTVSSTEYKTIQAAVNAAINDGGTAKKFIKISTGTYNEVVYIPTTNVPLCIYGAGSSPSDTKITLRLGATVTGSDYVSLVGSLFSSSDPAYNMFSSCANKSALGTACSAIFWVKSPNVQIVNLYIENSSNKTGTDQALALYAQSDKVQVDKCRLLSHQDTFCSGDGGSGVQRSHITDTYIEGDIDFVFGGSSTVFENCTFHAKADRRQDLAVIFAPDTDPSHTYGYLVIDSKITGDSAWSSNKQVYLARAWDSGVGSPSSYVAGQSPNGQLVIKESSIADVVDNNAPYHTATSGRTYSGNASINRTLDDNTYNRFWEYNNTGSGA